MKVKLSVPGARDKILGVSGVFLTALIFVVIYAAILAALWYVPEFLVWVRQLSVTDGKSGAIGWGYGKLIMILLPLVILIVIRIYQRLAGLWSFINYEDNERRFSFDFTHRQWWPRPDYRRNR